MSEKRFIIVKSIENLYAIVDKERADKEQILILSLHKEQVGVVCDLLNEQQATIDEQKIIIEERDVALDQDDNGEYCHKGHTGHKTLIHDCCDFEHWNTLTDEERRHKCND